jgi:putative PIN family toxin of toxin-antitoxin system
VRLIDAGRVQLVTSLELLAEARDVLSRPFVLQRFPRVTGAAINTFLQELAYTAELWREIPAVVNYPRDPGDEPYLNLAVVASPDFLVTRDADFCHSLTRIHRKQNSFAN